MAMKKSIGRTLADIDVAANTSVRIHGDFFNTHRDSHHRSQNATFPGLLVISGFLDTYPAQTVLAHAQNLVSGYATYQASGIQSVNPSPLLGHFLWKTFLG